MSARTVTLSQAAIYLGIKKRTFYNMISDGRFAVDPIPGTKPRRWLCDHLDAWAGRQA